MRHPDRCCPVQLIDCHFGMLAVEQEAALVRPASVVSQKRNTHTHAFLPRFGSKELGNVSVFSLIWLVCCHFAPGRRIHPGHPLQDHWSITHIASSLFVVSLSPCFVSTLFSFFFLLVFPPFACTVLESPSHPPSPRSLPLAPSVPFLSPPLCHPSV